jgi:sarcosine oxidase, subunit delta
MLLIECPYCGKRPELEFSHAGQAHIARAKNPAEVSVQEWTDFLYMRDNVKGVHAERWRHTHGCARFFNALRDTTTDHFLATYKAGEPAPVVAGASANVGPGVGASVSPAPSAGSSADSGAGAASGAPKVGL